MNYSSPPITVPQPKRRRRIGPFRGQPNDASIRHKSRSFNIIFWNAGGLSHTKFSELKTILHVHQIDLFIVAEAGSATDTTQFYQVDNYTIHTLQRSRQVASGMIVGIMKDLPSKFKIIHEMDEDDKMEAIQVDCWIDNNHFRVVGVYNPPNNVFNDDRLGQTIDNDTIVIGDFNAPSVRWGCSRTTTVGRAMEDFIDSVPITLLTTDHTFLSFAGHLGKPDLILPHASIADRCQHQLLEDPSGCGHKIILLKTRPKENVQPRKRLTRWNFKKANWTAFAEDTDERLKNISPTGNPNSTMKKITKAILEIAELHIPRGQVKKYSPFWSEELTKLKKERDDARHTAEESNNLGDCIKLRRAQAKLQRAIVNSKRSKFRDFIAGIDFRKDGTKAHKFISRLNNESKNFKAHPIKHGQEIIVNREDIANLFCKLFSSRPDCQHFKNHRKIATPATALNGRDINLFQADFNLSELRLAISEIRCGRSCGIDDVCPEFIVHLGKEAQKTLLMVMNESWRIGIPDTWKKAVVVPVFKKGKDPEKLSSYRPISLTSVTCKVMERMVNRRLEAYIERTNIIREEQAGFRKHKSTTDQVNKLSQCVKDGFHRKMSTLACFIDFRGAYDTVSRKLLYNKIANYGVAGNMLNWINQFLSQRFIRVRYGNRSSQFRQQRRGLPQGAVSSCTLFNLYMNDLICNIKVNNPGVEVLCYADDVIIWATSSSINSLETKINETLGGVKRWCFENDMIINENKTTAQFFTLSTKAYDPHVVIGTTDLPITRSTRYLGIALDSKLQWSGHIEGAVTKAAKRLNMMKRLTGTKWGATQDVLITTYKSYIRPILEYGSEAYNTASDNAKKDLNTVQNNALRLICGAAKSTPITALESQTDIEPLNARRDKATIKFFERALRTNDDFWKKYRCANQRLKTQVTPLAKAAEIRRRHGLEESERQPFKKTKYIKERTEIPSCTSIPGVSLRKADIQICELKALTEAMISERYPADEWLRVYTDGSAMHDACGAGYFSSIGQKSIAVGKNGTNFEGEVTAIGEAAREILLSANTKKVVFLSDSTSAIQAITSPKPQEGKEINNCQKTLRMLQKTTQIAVQWVPGHCGIRGNEKADSLAKHGCSMVQPILPLSYRSVCRSINSTISDSVKRDRKQAATGKQWEKIIQSSIPLDLPRGVAVALFRMTTGHDYLQRHLHRMKVVDTPICPLCSDNEGTAEHLTTCDGLKDVFHEESREGLATLYWEARRRMAERPRTGVG